MVDVCRKCYPPSQHSQTTAERGYGHDHRQASERYRFEHPLCERCVCALGVLSAQPSEEMHHVVSIADNPNRRMDSANWLALCRPCHELLEHDVFEGQKIKRWSECNYDNALNGEPVYG